MGKIKIVSDFTDYYDNLCDDTSQIVYKRNLSDCMQRGKALNFLQSKSIRTIEVKPVTAFNSWDNKLVVYKDPIAHHGEGKEIVDINFAKSMYPNCLASKYIESDNFLTVKFLQLGKRRFTITYQSSALSLDKGTIINISESASEYNVNIPYPIFSIDYISINNVMIATDFNEVENLQLLNFEAQVNAESVVEEIKQALLFYNKV